MKKYRKKPLVIEAVQWNGDEHLDYVIPFVQWDFHNWYYDNEEGEPVKLFIKTLEGDMECKIGDYIIKGIKGECYPVKADLFHELYDEIKDDQD